MKKFLKGLFVLLGIFPMLLLLVSYWSIHVDPLTSKIFPLMAYAFPYVVLLNVFAVALLLFMKSWKLGLFNILLLVAGYRYITRVYALGAQSESSLAELKILSYNVRAFDVGNRFDLEKGQIRDSIFDFLSKEDAGVYCFQEFYYENTPRKYLNIDEIYTVTKTKYYASSEDETKFKKRHSGVFTFSKYPIVNKGVIAIDNQSDFDGKCIFTDIQINDSSLVRIYNFHLASIRYQEEEYEFVEQLNINTEISTENKATGMRMVRMFLDASKRRSRELKLVLDHASKCTYPIVICGDMNDTPSSFAYHQFRSKFLDAFQQAGWGLGKTYSGKMPSNRIDFIFHSEHFKTIQFHLQKEVLSDHQAIGAELITQN